MKIEIRNFFTTRVERWMYPRYTDILSIDGSKTANDFTWWASHTRSTCHTLIIDIFRLFFVQVDDLLLGSLKRRCALRRVPKTYDGVEGRSEHDDIVLPSSLDAEVALVCQEIFGAEFVILGLDDLDRGVLGV